MLPVLRHWLPDRWVRKAPRNSHVSTRILTYNARTAGADSDEDAGGTRARVVARMFFIRLRFSICRICDTCSKSATLKARHFASVAKDGAYSDFGMPRKVSCQSIPFSNRKADDQELWFLMKTLNCFASSSASRTIYSVCDLLSAKID